MKKAAKKATVKTVPPAGPARWGVHWFRRDLRVTGNPALEWNRERTDGRVLGLYCVDPEILARRDFSPERFAFFLRTLEALRAELRALGGDLLVTRGSPLEIFRRLLELTQGGSLAAPAQVSWNRDYEPYARERDTRVEILLNASHGIEVHEERDHLLLEPEEISKPDGTFYSVYTPFARRWFEALATSEIQERLHSRILKPLDKGAFRLRWDAVLPPRSLPDCLDELLRELLPRLRVPLPKAGHRAALQALECFAPRLRSYDRDRDYPEHDGTSRLSVHLKTGAISAAQVLARLRLGHERLKTKTGPAQFVRELAWREFYHHILWHCPRVEHEAFREQYRDLAWENDERKFAAWKEGRTGFPIVDAGMRQLATTGWMHNRVRMIVASFLAKDLLIDWRWGERHFMEHLLDGDLAANNGGWQWAASTGCDPQPYFRIFSPELQSRRYDPEGGYIRRFVPELASLPEGADIHAPSPDDTRGRYPSPLVNHAEQRARALALFRRPDPSRRR